MKIDKTTLDLAKGVLKGAARGGLIGSGAALFTGAAVFVAAPVWMPVIGGMSVVALATVSTWAVVGAGLGASTGAAITAVKAAKTKRDFDKHFQKKE